MGAPTNRGSQGTLEFGTTGTESVSGAGRLQSEMQSPRDWNAMGKPGHRPALGSRLCGTVRAACDGLVPQDITNPGSPVSGAAGVNSSSRRCSQASADPARMLQMERVPMAVRGVGGASRPPAGLRAQPASCSGGQRCLLLASPWTPF